MMTDKRFDDVDPNLLNRQRLRQMVEAVEPGSVTAGNGPTEAAEQARGLRTVLTAKCDLTHPFVGAGMGFVALPELVAAVCNAGGLGVFGVAPEPPPVLPERIAQIMALTKEPFGIDFFLAGSEALGQITVQGHIDAVIAAKTSGAPIGVVVFHFETPPAEWVSAIKEAGIDVWAQVPSVEDGLAALAVGVDALIAQGRGAGGHSKSKTPLKKLLKQLREATPPELLILAAGGIARGKDVARALAHGADGVWVGTRLLASTESYAHPEYKQRIVDSQRKDGTVVTTLFGPELPCQPYRVLRNEVVEDNIDQQDTLCTQPADYSNPIGITKLFPGTSMEDSGVPMPAFSALPPTRDTINGDFDKMGLPAGSSARKIKAIKPVAEIIGEMMAEAHQCISAALADDDFDLGEDDDA